MGADVSSHLKRLIAIFLAILTWAIVSLINLTAPAFADPTASWVLSPFPVAYVMLIPLLWWRYRSAFPVAMAILIIGIVVMGISIAESVMLANYLILTWLVFGIILKAIGVFFCYTAYRETR